MEIRITTTEINLQRSETSLSPLPLRIPPANWHWAGRECPFGEPVIRRKNVPLATKGEEKRRVHAHAIEIEVAEIVVPMIWMTSN
jgi:hypothetical protein